MGRLLGQALVVAVVSILCAEVLHAVLHTPVAPVAAAAFLLGLVAGGR